MNRVEAALRRIAAELDSRQARWALVGGFAVSARTEPRLTRDIDVAVLIESDSAAEQLVRSLTAAGYGLGALVEQDAVGRLATVGLISPNVDGVGVVVDLIFAMRRTRVSRIDTSKELSCSCRGAGSGRKSARAAGRSPSCARRTIRASYCRKPSHKGSRDSFLRCWVVGRVAS